MDNKKILLSIDLDGTLLRDDKKIDDVSFKYINRLKDSGYKLVINTGRSYRTAARFFKDEIDIDIICNNGNLCRNVRSEEDIFINPIKKEDALLFLNDLDDNKIQALTHINLYKEGYDIATIDKKDMDEKCRLYIGGFGDHVLYVNDFDEVEADITSIVFVGEYEDLLPYKLKFSEMSDKFNYFLMRIQSKNNYMLEILPKKSNKWYGLEEYMENKNLTSYKKLCIGDDENDRLMIEEADYGIAMLNSKDDLKANVAFVSDYDNNNLGAIKAIEKILKTGDLDEY
ncbi:HAD-IIB family hydrolase [Peptoniphilus obesi]|uniref:HAD-IIB family hydrolase n=1 Tax=Peptoniphilus obesi TaxID=1472765 RepID=UPI0004AE5B61|nr:HAD-IIB family hydrolase [Peptoniphilus obesi]